MKKFLEKIGTIVCIGFGIFGAWAVISWVEVMCKNLENLPLSPFNLWNLLF